jgi:prepilin-type N-terminal cleavage/methylation domain-containing protein
MKKNKAFTLVELIVVITILAILATVAYISFQWYSQSARDSTRLANMRLIEKALSLYVTTNSFFPEPSNSVNMTFNNGSPVTLWKKWIVWESVHRTLKTLSEIPTDPITGEEYGYAVTLNKKEYELKAFMESTTAFHTNNKVKAFDYIPRIRGNYNKLFLLWADSNYYSVPSLFGTWVDVTSTTNFEIDNSQVDYQVTQLLDQSSNPITPSSFSDPSKFEDFWRALLDAYTWSQLAWNSSYTELFTNSSSQDYTYFAKVALWEDPWETQSSNNTCSIVSESPSKSCNNNSWSLNSWTNQCTNQLTTSLWDSCPSGYTNNWNSTCSQTNSYSATAVCPSWYSNYSTTTCRRITTRSADLDCQSGYDYYTNNCYRNRTANVCPSWYTLRDYWCDEDAWNDVVDPTCASWYVHVWWERCYDPNDTSSIVYACDSWFTYNWSNCERTQYASKTYSCNSWWTLNWTLCETTDTIASTPWSCPSGYILQADWTTCLLDESEAAIITCNSWFTYNSSTDNCERCE